MLGSSAPGTRVKAACPFAPVPGPSLVALKPARTANAALAHRTPHFALWTPRRGAARGTFEPVSQWNCKAREGPEEVFKARDGETGVVARYLEGRSVDRCMEPHRRPSAGLNVGSLQR